MVSTDNLTFRAAWAQCARYTSDSRKAGPRVLFHALPGILRDGHDFVEAALEAGSPFAVVDQEFFKQAPAAIKDRLIAVDDRHHAHRQSAAHYRSQFRGPVIAVGGSNGKTSTKDFLAAFLSQNFRVLKTEKSQNGELGIPKTLEGLNSEFDIAVIEVGIDGPGDMARHVEIVRPTHAVMTSIGEEHLNLFQTIDVVFAEEIKLLQWTVEQKGTAFVPADDAWLQRWKPSHFEKQIVRVAMSAHPEHKWPFIHPMAIRNGTLAYAVARAVTTQMNSADLALQNLDAAILKLQLPEGRGALISWRGHEVIGDYYNANFNSMSEALGLAGSYAQKQTKPLALILGDMFDLGAAAPEVHRRLVPVILAQKPQYVFLVGPLMSALAADLGPLNRVGGQANYIFCYEDTDHACRALSQSLPFESSVILLKGSRGMALEKILRC